ncbi:MAG: hypothetical protein ACR2M7_05200, partial [Bdellovibrionales bacterium]
CQEVRAATQQNPINVRTPGTSSTDLTGTQFAFNQDEGGPGTTPAPDDSVVPLDDDGFPEGAKPADTEQFGFGRIEKNGSPGGSPGGGPGLGGGTPNYDDYGGANYDTLPDDYGHWEVGAGPGGGFGPYGDDEDSNAYRYPSGEGEGDGSDKVALGDGSDVDLDQYIDIDANEKSIFQIVSLRIQEYCSTKIKEQCL